MPQLLERQPCAIYPFMDIDEQIRRFLVERMDSSGRSQQHFADLVGNDKGNFSKKRNGQHKFTNQEVYKIALALGYTLTEMAAEIEKRMPGPSEGELLWRSAYDPVTAPAVLALIGVKPKKKGKPDKPSKPGKKKALPLQPAPTAKAK